MEEGAVHEVRPELEDLTGGAVGAGHGVDGQVVAAVVVGEGDPPRMHQPRLQGPRDAQVEGGIGVGALGGQITPHRVLPGDLRSAQQRPAGGERVLAGRASPTFPGGVPGAVDQAQQCRQLWRHRLAEGAGQILQVGVTRGGGRLVVTGVGVPQVGELGGRSGVDRGQGDRLLIEDDRAEDDLADVAGGGGGRPRAVTVDMELHGPGAVGVGQ